MFLCQYQKLETLPSLLLHIGAVQAIPMTVLNDLGGALAMKREVGARSSD